MIQPKTQLLVQDNSGARVVECITVCKTRGRQPGGFSDFAVVSVKKLRKKGRIKVKKKEICIALILKLVKPGFRKNGLGIKFSSNTCILLDREFQNHGTRIFGTVRKELRNSNSLKVLSISSNFI
jgi:large subunit ribosomal protein L14